MRWLKRHLFLYLDTFGSVTPYHLLTNIKKVYAKLCNSYAFEAMTESDCGLQDCFTYLLSVSRNVDLDGREDTHLMDLWRLAGLDPADDEVEFEYDLDDEEELVEVFPESEAYDSGNDSGYIEVVNDAESYSSGTELEEVTYSGNVVWGGRHLRCC